MKNIKFMLAVLSALFVFMPHLAESREVSMQNLDEDVEYSEGILQKVISKPNNGYLVVIDGKTYGLHRDIKTCFCDKSGADLAYMNDFIGLEVEYIKGDNPKYLMVLRYLCR